MGSRGREGRSGSMSSVSEEPDGPSRTAFLGGHRITPDRMCGRPPAGGLALPPPQDRSRLHQSRRLASAPLGEPGHPIHSQGSASCQEQKRNAHPKRAPGRREPIRDRKPDEAPISPLPGGRGRSAAPGEGHRPVRISLSPLTLALSLRERERRATLVTRSRVLLHGLGMTLLHLCCSQAPSGSH
jgi:hypothetical protein